MQALFPAEIPWLAADWPLADRFVAGTSMTANPLVTQGFNLARHVADEPSRVEAARARLAALLPEARWLWLSQVHSATVWQAADYQAGVEGDALVSREAARVPVVMTAIVFPCCWLTATRRYGQRCTPVGRGCTATLSRRRWPRWRLPPLRSLPGLARVSARRTMKWMRHFSSALLRRTGAMPRRLSPTAPVIGLPICPRLHGCSCRRRACPRRKSATAACVRSPTAAFSRTAATARRQEGWRRSSRRAGSPVL